MRASSKVTLIFLVILVVLSVAIWYAVIREERGDILRVSFLDIGQGDAIFIDAPSGRQVLIDGRKGSAVLRQLASVMPWYDKTIDVVVGTHPDQDHIGGLVEILRRYRVPLVVKSSVLDAQGADFIAFEKAITEERGVEVFEENGGKIFSLGAGASFEILFPVGPQVPPHPFPL